MYTLRIGDVRRIHFREDVWIGDQSFSALFPRLFFLPTLQCQASIAEMCVTRISGAPHDRLTGGGACFDASPFGNSFDGCVRF